MRDLWYTFFIQLTREFIISYHEMLWVYMTSCSRKSWACLAHLTMYASHLLYSCSSSIFLGNVIQSFLSLHCWTCIDLSIFSKESVIIGSLFMLYWKSGFRPHKQIGNLVSRHNFSFSHFVFSAVRHSLSSLLPCLKSGQFHHFRGIWGWRLWRILLQAWLTCTHWNSQ